MPNNTDAVTTAPKEDVLLNEAEAAKVLDVKPATLSVWRSNKRYPLPYLKIGRLVRYRRSTLDAFLNSCARETA